VCLLNVRHIEDLPSDSLLLLVRRRVSNPNFLRREDVFEAKEPVWDFPFRGPIITVS